MAAEMMNGGLFQPNEAAVSLPWILIAEVASHCSEFNGKQTFRKLCVDGLLEGRDEGGEKN